MPFAHWPELPPARAARDVHRRINYLPAELRRAAIAWLPTESELALAFASAVAGPLRGVPWFVKDLFDVAGAPTQAGSTFLASVRATPGDSEIVRRLRSQGAVLAGKSHLVEFASGLTGENPHYGDCPNPRFDGRLSGGSSSGSAALVAAGVVPLAAGTDTGGSVRVPAAFCGLHGFRLTPGDPLIRDAFPLSPTMDTAGWFTATAPDMLTAWRVLTGAGGPADKAPRGCFLRGRSVVPTMAPAVAEACDRAAAAFASPADRTTAASLLGAWNGAVDAYLTIGMTEAHAIHRNWLAPFREHYDPMIWERFNGAGRVPSDNIAAAHARAADIRANWAEFFAAYDFLVFPSAPTPALRKNECTPEARRAILTLTAPASLGGLPCLCLPVPLPDGLSAGLQVILPRPDSPVVGWLLHAAPR